MYYTLYTRGYSRRKTQAMSTMSARVGVVFNCRKTKTKSNHSSHYHKGYRQYSKPIKIRSNYMQLT